MSGHKGLHPPFAEELMGSGAATVWASTQTGSLTLMALNGTVFSTSVPAISVSSTKSVLSISIAMADQFQFNIKNDFNDSTNDKSTRDDCLVLFQEIDFVEDEKTARVEDISMKNCSIAM
uniref:Uncharacterized protein n=1 Tax=Onchocerca volvulus TaxID=6282 RepID=A0A8R1TLU3_ONCVO